MRSHGVLAASLPLLFAFLAIARGARQERRGPVFTRAPPGRIEFLNSSQTAVPCEAQGTPRPEVWWWRVGSQGPSPDIPGLRHVRAQDGALVFSPFRAEDFRQDIHAAVYRCGARNSVGSIVSGDVHVRAGKFGCLYQARL
ncbi:cell adhesion molecule Dscam1-like [Haemaphysalis longicornis]